MVQEKFWYQKYFVLDGKLAIRTEKYFQYSYMFLFSKQARLFSFNAFVKVLVLYKVMLPDPKVELLSLTKQSSLAVKV